ncbi:DUF4362 domain-containing protein [Rossellomorea vietnamensis]|uniref:DUF4362 domain-containing protein n=1 Tax=Rossellomorea vietnamensis TaxID=218284 RepID=UPI003D2909BA
MKGLSACFMIGFILLSGCSNSAPENEKQYTMEESKENGDTIVDEEGKVENLDKLLQFIDQVNENKSAQVVVTNFANRQVSLNELSYEGNTLTYILKSGTGEEEKNATCGSIEQKSGSISLQGCEGEEPVIGLVQVSEYQINKAKASMKN